MKLTQELELELRAMINPIYVDVKGTESFERNLLLGEIDRLRAYIKHLGGITDTCISTKLRAYINDDGDWNAGLLPEDIIAAADTIEMLRASPN